MLTIAQLHKTFGDYRVLKGVDLALAQGTLTAIIGPNGCGKSTLFNVITGELPPTSGEISYNDISLIGKRPREIAKLGILRKFQIPGIYPHLSVSEHLALPAAIHKAGKNAAKRDEIIETMGLKDLLDKTGSVLATGQKQWLELAMLVLLKPRLLLLDEPIAGMTAAEAEKTLTILQNLNRQGLAIVAIEHNIDFVKALTDDIVVIMDGKVAMRDCYQAIADDENIRRNYLGSLYA